MSSRITHSRERSLHKQRQRLPFSNHRPAGYTKQVLLLRSPDDHFRLLILSFDSDVIFMTALTLRELLGHNQVVPRDFKSAIQDSPIG